ncbi:heme-binding protein 2-like [Ruditapes philippinarum]|uniref:heme-binding protein 2-like n=1 Tax=Ruditapes philippinarum TaxID=129788 RepID=UPI00295AD9F7|nr:heme-binding protein 2-like [Ruditapes philippinarum]
MLSIAILFMCVGTSVQSGFLLNSFNLPGLDNTHQTTNVFQKPAFCHDLDCPEYEVLETNDKFEVRRYKPSMWVATETVAFYYTDKESREMFFKLFHYISGNNSRGMKIAMTTPVVTEVLHGPGPDCESNFTMHFMIPFALQNNPPQPTESGVFFKHFPEAIRYVKQYGGFTSDDKKRENLEQFINDLNAAGKKYHDDRFFTMEYDGPYSIVRHNEIWVTAL